MGNHYHLLGQFPDRNMSKVMHWIGMCYSQQINRRYDFTGRLCRDRFFNSPIEDDDYFKTVVRYIHRNPIDLNVRPQNLAYYSSSSYGIYLGLRTQPDWLRTDLALDLFDNNLAEFRRFTEQSVPTDLIDKNQAG